MDSGSRKSTRKRRGLSFQVLVVVPFCIALAIQGLLYVAVFSGGRIFDQMDDDAYDLFSERVASNAGYLENDMVFRWSNFGPLTEVVASDVASALASHGATSSSVATGSDLALSIVDAAADDLVSFARRGEVDGVYLVLANDGEDEGSRTAFYVRDSNPKLSIDGDSDLMLAACPISVGKRLGLALDSQWTSTFQLGEEGGDQSAFFFRPYRAAEQYPDARSSDLGYWGRPVDLGWSGTQSITYSVPLRAPDGGVVAVLGIEVRLDRVTAFLPYGDLNESGDGSYLLAVANEYDGFGRESGVVPLVGSPRGYEVMATTGATQSLYVQNGSVWAKLDEKGRMVIEPSAESASPEATAVASAAEIPLYDSTSPFASEHWAVVGLAREDGLFHASRTLSENLVRAFLVSVVIGLIVAGLTAWLSSSRLRNLMREVRTARPEEPIAFTPTGIVEVDELSDAIESLGSEVASAASRLSQILRLSDRSIGAFEYNAATNSISYTDGFFATLATLEPPDAGSFDLDALAAGDLSPEDFARFVHSYDEYLEAEGENRYLVTGPHRAAWVRLVVMPDDGSDRVYGLVEEVTHEIETRRRIEHERDHDILTGLLNRRAFEQEVTDLLAHDAPACGAMLMLDLDNLKFVNDTYGHDWGDQYIKAAGKAVAATFAGKGFYSRVSGDEFLVFIDACATREQVDLLLADFVRALDVTTLTAPDGKLLKVRASMGAARYPEDAADYGRLREYADFSMYLAKSSRKGQLFMFDRKSYEEKSFILNNKEDLNNLIDEDLIDYHFQPIVDARAGEVVAYEALMRPQVDSLPTPDHVLELARSQSKLYQIEHLTFFGALKAFSQRCGTGNAVLFINSIATQRLSSDDELALRERYGDLLGRLVIEIIESDYSREMSVYKEALAHRLGARLAIDDYGSGYNGETSLLDMRVDFVKLDAGIVRGIEGKVDQRDIARNLIRYAHDRGIHVIAEGVETEAELHAVVALDVDYLQGYLLGRPAPVPSDVPEDVKELVRAAGGPF